MLTYSASTPGITRLPQQTQARVCSQGKIPPFHYNPVKAETLPGINGRELGIQRTLKNIAWTKVSLTCTVMAACFVMDW